MYELRAAGMMSGDMIAMVKFGGELEVHHSLYEGVVYNMQEWQKEADEVLCHCPQPSYCSRAWGNHTTTGF